MFQVFNNFKRNTLLHILLVGVGGEEPNERGGVDGEGELRGEHKVQAEADGGRRWRCSPRRLEDAGPGQEATGQEGGSRGRKGGARYQFYGSGPSDHFSYWLDPGKKCESGLNTTK